jgi:N-acetylmuramic acid 6-phosphate (MurNAc-6-P) etherase
MARTYTMSAEQSREWAQGGASALHLADEIAEDLQDAGISDDVDVLLDDGRVVYTLWQPER